MSSSFKDPSLKKLIISYFSYREIILNFSLPSYFSCVKLIIRTRRKENDDSVWMNHSYSCVNCGAGFHDLLHSEFRRSVKVKFCLRINSNEVSLATDQVIMQTFFPIHTLCWVSSNCVRQIHCYWHIVFRQLSLVNRKLHLEWQEWVSFSSCVSFGNQFKYLSLDFLVFKIKLFWMWHKGQKIHHMSQWKFFDVTE